MESFNVLNRWTEDLNKNGISSYNDYDENSSWILEYLEKYIAPSLKIEIKDFFDLLFNTKVPYYLKKISLEQKFGELKVHSNYMLSLYVNNLDAYRNAPLLFKLLIEKLNITQYAGASLEMIKNYIDFYLDINETYISTFGRDSHEIKIKRTMNSSIYECFDQIPVFCPENSKYFFAWGENDTVISEQKNPNNTYAIWVSRYHGDGFGFDVLSFNNSTGREKLIEVKTGVSNDFTLTNNEYKVMQKSNNYNADYFIYKYTYDRSKDDVKLRTYQYDLYGRLISENEMFDFYTNIYEEEYGPVKSYRIKKIGY